MKQFRRLSDTSRELIYEHRKSLLPMLSKAERDLEAMVVVAQYYRYLRLCKDPELALENVQRQISRAQFYRYKKIFDERYLSDADGN